MDLKFQNVDLNLRYLVLDYTGTLSEHGTLIDCVKPKLIKLSNEFEKILVLTADTFGTAETQLKGLPVEVVVFDSKTGKSKRELVEKLGSDHCVTIGNGNNDIEMFKVSALSIAVINRDGCNAKLIQYADLVFNSICDALNSLINPKIAFSLLRE